MNKNTKSTPWLVEVTAKIYGTIEVFANNPEEAEVIAEQEFRRQVRYPFDEIESFAEELELLAPLEPGEAIINRIIVEVDNGT